PLVATLTFGAAGCDRAADPMPESPMAPSVHVMSAVSHGGAPQLASQLAPVRALTAKFHNFDYAWDAGWNLQVTPCLENPPLGGMGYHFANPAFIDGTVTALEPEVLVYEPQKNGRLRFVAVEYIVPWAIVPETAPPPVLFGEEFLPNPGAELWMMHVWIGAHNPDGLLATWNPNVNCQFAN
ncbi:MAG TPA: hypothetical protein VMM79_18260, partial [Longimicrobiales bacterium]|nr:hypothetical protein [Longimicrobiales bacterium]